MTNQELEEWMARYSWAPGHSPFPVQLQLFSTRPYITWETLNPPPDPRRIGNL